MGVHILELSKPTYTVSSLILICLIFVHTNVYVATGGSSPSMAQYTPPDNYLINCGSPESTLLDDGRTFKSDPQSSSFLSADENILTSADPNSFNISSSSVSFSSLPLYRTARIFSSESMYRFLIFRPGRHWLRLHFYPLPHSSYNLTNAVFTVKTDSIVLLHDFSVSQNTEKLVFKEYLINITSDRFSLIFSPMKKSFAFANAIELVSAPDELISDSASAVSPVGAFNGISNYALEVSYRLNVGGPIITPKNDTLSRTWQPDNQFMAFSEGAKTVSMAPDIIKYPEGGATPFIAPNWVYSTAKKMADSGVSDPNFNLTWEMNIDSSFSYLIRLHFCDIVSTKLDELYFNVYVNGMTGASSLDLSTLSSGLAVPYYKDFVLNVSAISNGSITVQVGPCSNVQPIIPNAILNGLEVMKMSNSDGALDGLFSSGGANRAPILKPSTVKIAEIFGLVMGVAAILLLVTSIIRWKRSPQDWEKRGSFSSWLLPLNSGQCSFLSRKSKISYSSVFFSGPSLGRFFTFNELKDATRNFDENEVIGIGGFGKVYIGELEDGIKVAIKRGNASSSQGINEFQTEIQMLSKLRHRHLVSLIGYCDEQSEMILVYEYMSNGPFRDHLYGSTLPPLTWRQRLDICIGAARGLHYLHTGAAQGIIHRDVKTTNILLDENFVAKVSDFGLSKDAPALDQTHVSTAVKGSFGYLDPEYFRRQQITDKSDVYSFGVVLFEVLSARPALDPTLPREQVNLAEWAMKKNKKGLIEKIIDPRIVGSISSESLMKYVETAEKCLGEYGVDRPSMGDVLWNLEFALQLQEASSQLDPPEEKNGEKIIDMEERRDEEQSIIISDDSGLVVGSPLFSNFEEFQGR